MKYNFQQYKARYIRSFTGLYLGISSIHITPLAYEAIGRPSKVELFYDKENNAIQIKEAEIGRIVTQLKGGRSFTFSCKLSDILPKGKYQLNDDKVFVLNKDL